MSANFFSGVFTSAKDNLDAPDVMKAATDQLSAHYSALAKDKTKMSGSRDAAVSFAVAEGYLEDGDNFEECLQAVVECLNMFRSAGDGKGEADSLRLNIHALRCKAECFGKKVNVEDRKKRSKFLDEAEELAVKSRASFKAQNNSRGEAAMLLSFAEVNLMEGRGTNKRNEAVEAVFDAKKLIAGCGDSTLEAAILHKLIEVHIESKALQDARATADEALSLCQKAGNKIELAKAWHMIGHTRILADAFEDGVKAGNEARRLFRELNLKKLEACEGFALAQYNFNRGKSFVAMPIALEALGVFRQLPYAALTAQAFDQVVECYIACGHKKEALRLAQEGLTECVKSKDKRAEACALRTLSFANLSCEKNKEALSAGEEAVDACAGLRDPRLEAMMHSDVANVHLAMGELKEAEKSVEEGLGLVQSVHDARAEAALLNQLAKVHLAMNDIAAATQAISEQRALFQQAGDKSMEAESLLRLATCRSFEGNMPEAMDNIAEAKELSESADNKRLVARCCNMVAELKSAQGQLEEALTAAEEMRACLKATGDQVEEAKAMELMCDLHIKRDNAKEAVKLSSDGGLTAKLNGDKPMQVRMWTLLAHAQAALLSQESEAAISKKRSLALKPATEALSLAKRLDDKELIGSALYTMATVKQMTGQASEAMPLLNEARTIFYKSGNRPTEIAVVIMMAKVQGAKDEKEKALETAKEAKQMADGVGDSAQASEAAALMEKYKPAPVMPAGAFMMAAPAGGQAALPAAGGDASAAAGGGAAAAVAAAPEEKGLTREVALGTVVEVAKQIIGGDEALDQDTALMDAGLDSLSALSFRQSLSNQVGLKLPASFIFDYPSVKEVADRIVELSQE